MQSNHKLVKEITNTILAKYTPLLYKDNDSMNLIGDGKTLYLLENNKCIQSIDIDLNGTIETFEKTGGLFSRIDGVRTIDWPFSILEADKKENQYTHYHCAEGVTPLFMNLGLLELLCNNGQRCNFVDSLMIWIMLNFTRIPDSKTNLYEGLDKNVFIYSIPDELYITRNQPIILGNDISQWECKNYLYSINNMYELYNLNPTGSYPNVVSFEQIARRYYKIFGSCTRDILNPCVCREYGLDVKYDFLKDTKREKIDLVIEGIPVACAINTKAAWNARGQKVEVRHAKIDYDKQLKILTTLPKSKYDIYLWDKKDIDIIKDALSKDWEGEKTIYVGEI